MATQAEKLVRIEDSAGRRAAVTEADYLHKKMAALHGQTYKDAGYNIVSYEDGTPYEDGVQPTKYALTNARAGEIGADTNTGHTNIDGGALTADEKAAAGISEPAPATPARARTAASAPTEGSSS